MSDLRKMAEKSAKKVSEVKDNKEAEKKALNSSLQQLEQKLTGASAVVHKAVESGDNEAYLNALSDQRTIEDNIKFFKDRISIIDSHSVSAEMANKEIEALGMEVEKASKKELSAIIVDIEKLLTRLGSFFEDVESANSVIMSWAKECGEPYPASSIPHCEAKLQMKYIYDSYKSNSGFDGRTKLQQLKELV